MATKVIRRGQHARLACDRCECEIHAMGDPHLLARHPANLGASAPETPGWAVVAGYSYQDRAAYHPENCDCSCHASAKRFLTNKYE